MSKSIKILIVLIVVAAVAIIAIIEMGKKDTKEVTHSHDDTSSQTAEDTSSDQVAAATITYDGSSFSPNTTTVKTGDVVKVVNNSSNADLDFDSDPHPTHTNNPDLNAGDIEPGQSKTFSTDKTGTWGFHNHHNPSQHGELIVK